MLEKETGEADCWHWFTREVYKGVAVLHKEEDIGNELVELGFEEEEGIRVF